TLRYMSPEQASGKPGLVDHHTDIYSLGVSMYELATLETAFKGQDRGELLRRITSEEPAAPRKLNPSMPKELETIILKAIAKAPDERYGSARELARIFGASWTISPSWPNVQASWKGWRSGPA